jgi:hypothetical protein
VTTAATTSSTAPFKGKCRRMNASAMRLVEFAKTPQDGHLSRRWFRWVWWWRHR